MRIIENFLSFSRKDILDLLFYKNKFNLKLIKYI